MDQGGFKHTSQTTKQTKITRKLTTAYAPFEDGLQMGVAVESFRIRYIILLLLLLLILLLILIVLLILILRYYY